MLFLAARLEQQEEAPPLDTHRGNFKIFDDLIFQKHLFIYYPFHLLAIFANILKGEFRMAPLWKIFF